jgi:tetratricopeptide (TPR) repeat protein
MKVLPRRVRVLSCGAAAKATIFRATRLPCLPEILSLVTNLLRLLTRPVLPALAVLALGAPAFADTMLPLDAPDPYGSYLAGAQALKDLSGSDAERYLRDASTTQWNVPQVVQSDFVADLINGDIDRAASTASHLLDLTPGNSLAKLAVASTDLKDRRYRQVERDLADVPTGDFAGITAAVLRAWAYVGDGRSSDADAAMTKLGKGGLGDFLTFHRALMADISGDSSSAVKLITEAYNLDPTAPRTVEAYARILGNAGRFGDALAAVRKFDDQGLGDPAVEAVGKALAAHQRPGPYAANAQAGAAELYHAVALALARDGNNDLAIGLLQLGLYLDPHNDSIRLLIGQLLDGAGQHADANAYYADVPDDSPMHLTAAVRIAQNYDAMGDRPEALRELTNLAAANPNDVDTLTVLADMLRRDMQYDKAASIYTQAINIDQGAHPGDWILYYGRGIAYERGGHWDEAQPDFLAALKLDPGQPDVLNYLGYTWVDKGQNLDQALGMIQQAVKATPTDGFIVDSLGWAFYKLGRIPDAVSTLEEAVQLKPNDPQINDHLGDAYWKAGRKLEAHFQWNVAASLDPDATLKAQIEKKQAFGLGDGATASTATPATASPTVTQ